MTLHCPKENRKEKKNKINIKSEKLDKRKEKLSVSKAFYNNLAASSFLSQIFYSSAIFFTSIIFLFLFFSFFFCFFSFFFSFASFSFCFCYSNFSCFDLYCFLHFSGYFVIFTSPVLQSISVLFLYP